MKQNNNLLINKRCLIKNHYNIYSYSLFIQNPKFLKIIKNVKIYYFLILKQLFHLFYFNTLLINLKNIIKKKDFLINF